MKIRSHSLVTLWLFAICLVGTEKTLANSVAEQDSQPTTTEGQMLEFFVQFDGICRAGLMRYEKRLPGGIMETEDDVRHAYYACEVPSHALFKDYFPYKESFFREHFQGSNVSESDEFDAGQLSADVKQSHDEFLREIRKRRINELKVENAPEWIGKTVAEYTRRIIEQDQEVLNDFARRFTSIKPAGTEMEEKGTRLAKNRVLYEDLIWLEYQAGPELKKLIQCTSGVLHQCHRMLPPADQVSGAISKFKPLIGDPVLQEHFGGVLGKLKAIEDGFLCQVREFALEAVSELEARKEKQQEYASGLMVPSMELDGVEWAGESDRVPLTRLLLALPLQKLKELQPKVNRYRKSWNGH